MRPALMPNAMSATATSRWYTKSSMAVPRPSARSISDARNVTPASAASATGTGSSGPRRSVEEDVGAAVSGVVHQLLNQQRVDVLKEAGHRERQYLCGPAGFDARGVEGRLSGSADRLERADEASDSRRDHVLAGGRQAADVVERAHRVHLALWHVEDAVGADGADAAGVADVAAGLGVAVDEGADQFEIGVPVHGGDGMAADGSGGPLNDAYHRGAAYCKGNDTVPDCCYADTVRIAALQDGRPRRHDHAEPSRAPQHHRSADARRDRDGDRTGRTRSEHQSDRAAWR